MAGIRKKYSAEEKAKIVLEILKGEKTQSQLTAKYSIHSSQMYNWKKQAIEAIVSNFSEKQKRQAREQSELIEELYKQIGNCSLPVKNNLKKA